VVDRHTAVAIGRKVYYRNLASYKALCLGGWAKRCLEYKVLDEISEVGGL